MKTLKTIMLIALISLSVNTFAQLEGFDLSKYKLPELKRKTLDTYINIGADNDYYKTPYKQYDPIRSNLITVIMAI